MEEKGFPFNDEWHVETAKTVLLKNPYKENLIYEASLSCSFARKTYILEENENSPHPEHT